MKKATYILLSFLAVSVTSCVKETAVKPLSKKEMQKKVDSIMNARAKQLENDSRRDLQLRMRIEVKAKADSLLRSSTVKDTAAHKVDTVQTPHI